MEMKKILEILKAFGPVVASGMSIIAFGTIIYTWGVKSEQKQSDLSVLKSEFIEIKTIVAPLKGQIDSISSMVKAHSIDQITTSQQVNEKLDDLSGKQDKLKTLVTNEFSKSMTPKQVNEMWNMLEKKNSMTSMLKIQSTQGE